MTEKWIIENGEIKDTATNMTFDSFMEILIVLNGQSNKITSLTEENKQCKMMIATLRNIILENRIDVE